MQFHRSLYISFAAHVVIFGTALAFAHYNGERSRTFPGTLTLSLVGPGGFSAPRGHAKSGRGPRSSSLSESKAAMPEFAEREASPEQHAAEQDSGAGPMPGNEPVSSRGAGEAGNGGGGPYGPSPEEWSRIHARIEQVKTYPRIARERGIEGVVLLRFRVAPSGKVETVDVMKSSGSPVLDEASVRTLYRSAPLPAVNGWVEVPMSYIIK